MRDRRLPASLRWYFRRFCDIFGDGLVEILLWSAVTLTGWLLGGPVGIGTLIATFGAGIVMQLVYSLLRFEPRDIVHMDVLETTKVLLGRTGGDRPA